MILHFALVIIYYYNKLGNEKHDTIRVLYLKFPVVDAQRALADIDEAVEIETAKLTKAGDSGLSGTHVLLALEILEKWHLRLQKLVRLASTCK